MQAVAKRADFVNYLRANGTIDANYDDAELIYGELVSNVVRHAPGPIEVRVDWLDETPILHVVDWGPGFLPPELSGDENLAESGRGLLLVSHLATAMTVERTRTGTIVTAVLTIPRRNRAYSSETRLALSGS